MLRSEGRPGGAELRAQVVDLLLHAADLGLAAALGPLRGWHGAGARGRPGACVVCRDDDARGRAVGGPRGPRGGGRARGAAGGAVPPAAPLGMGAECMADPTTPLISAAPE